MSKPRRKRVAPGTRKTWTLANVSQDDIADILASLSFMSDYGRVLTSLQEFRAHCEANGKDAFEILARVVAHNWAVHEGTLRLKAKGAATNKKAAAARHEEIAQQFAESGNVKAVAIDRQSSDKDASSERTIRRVVGRKRQPR